MLPAERRHVRQKVVGYADALLAQAKHSALQV